jgi:hypothetical protein
VPAWLALSPDGCDLTFDGGPADAEIRVHHTQAEPKMLNQFVRLCDAKPNVILRFARRWGVLYLDARGRPCHPNGPSERREPIDVWKYFSRRARAVLNIAANLKLGKIGDLDDWAALRGTAVRTGDFLHEMDRYAPFLITMMARTEYPFMQDGSTSINPKYKRTVRAEMAFLSLEVSLWLRLGRVGFAVGATKYGWGLGVDYNECMLAAVALQLALVLADVKSLYQCSGCKLPYVRHARAPKEGQDNFCGSCGRAVALKMADRRRRQRNAARKL